MLCESGLLRVVQGLGTVDPARFVDALLAAVGALNPNNLTDDDVTVLLLRPTGSRPSRRSRPASAGWPASPGPSSRAWPRRPTSRCPT